MDDVDGITVRAERAGMHTFWCSFGVRNGKTKSPACPTAHILLTICQRTADANLIKELLHNCIAHQDYTLRGKINVEEFEDRLVVLNESAFIPETIETALEPGYKPPYYRNPFLVNAMVNMYMIDSNAIGIPRIFEIQKSRFFPLPSYDLSSPNRVRVTVYGKKLNPNYTKLLNSDTSLDIRTVFLLDKIQKKELISSEDFQELKKLGLAEGRYPYIHVSFSVAQAVGQPEDYFKNSGLGDERAWSSLSWPWNGTVLQRRTS